MRWLFILWMWFLGNHTTFLLEMKTKNHAKFSMPNICFYELVLPKALYNNHMAHLFQIFFWYMWSFQKTPLELHYHADLNKFSLSTITNCNKIKTNSAKQGNKPFRKSEGYSTHSFQTHETQGILVLTESYDFYFFTSPNCFSFSPSTNEKN